MAKKEETTEKKKGSFLADFNKKTAKMDGVSVSAPPPKFWLDTGCYVINKVLSGSYTKGYASGRLSALAGPSGAGKSFLLGNAIKSALNNKEQDWGVLVIDSENAIDEGYLDKIGANFRDNPLYNYRGVTTISQVVNIVSNFTAAYRAANEDLPFLIAIDSLDMLQTDSENEQYTDGTIKGDQGQHAKQIKAMLKRFVNDVKDLNILMVHTKQVYQEQDKIAALNDPWRMTESFKFAYSQIGMITRRRMKDKATKKFEGIHLGVRGEKNRFAKPFQTCTVDVPYDTGIDRYSGILDAAVALKIVDLNGAWYTFDGKKFQTSGFEDYRDAIFAKVLEKDNENLDVGYDYDDESPVMTAKEKELARKTLNEGVAE